MNQCVLVALQLKQVLLVVTADGVTYAVPLGLVLSTLLAHGILLDKAVVQMKSLRRVDTIAGKNADLLQLVQQRRTA